MTPAHNAAFLLQSIRTYASRWRLGAIQSECAADSQAFQTVPLAAMGSLSFVRNKSCLGARHGDWVRRVRFWGAITRGVMTQHATA
jgi:hypothetical protein